MFSILCKFTGEDVAYFTTEEKATVFLTELKSLTSDIQMIGGALLLNPLSESFVIKPILTDVVTALDIYEKILESKKQADEDFMNCDDDDDYCYDDEDEY